MYRTCAGLVNHIIDCNVATLKNVTSRDISIWPTSTSPQWCFNVSTSRSRGLALRFASWTVNVTQTNQGTIFLVKSEMRCMTATARPISRPGTPSPPVSYAPLTDRVGKSDPWHAWGYWDQKCRAAKYDRYHSSNGCSWGKTANSHH